MERVRNRWTLFTAKALILLIVPIVVESALNMSLGFFDGIMVSHIKGTSGDAPLTAVNYVDQISNLIIQLFSAFGVGGAVITSQYIGAKNIDDANKSAKQLIILMFLFSLVIMGLSLIFNHQIINLFFGELDEITLNFAYQYFYVTALSYPLLSIFYACAALLRAQRKSLNTMTSAFFSFILNIGLNALFIYVFELGVIGAALGTLIARIFPPVFLSYLLSKKGNLIRVKIFEKPKIDLQMTKKIAKLAIPGGIENTFFQLGKILVLSFISLKCYNLIINGQAVNVHSSANSVAMSINTLGCIVGNGINTSMLTVIGQAVGTGILAQVKHYMKKMLAISYIGNALSIAVFWSLSPLLMKLYGVSKEALEIGRGCLNLCFAFQLFTYPMSFGACSMLKANSDVKYVMVVSIISMLLMRVGLCFILTTDLLPIQIGAYGLWWGMIADWILRGILFGVRLLSGKWQKASGLIKEETE